MITVTPLIPMTFQQYCHASGLVLARKDLVKARKAYDAAANTLHRLDKRDTARRSRRYDLQRRLHRMVDAGDYSSARSAVERKVADLDAVIEAGWVVIKATKALRSSLGDKYFADRKAALADAGLPEAWPFSITVA
jgi:3-hydroxyacyl-CoA dehydrogenase